MDTLPFDPWREEPEPERSPEPALPEESAALPMIVCWRCGKDVSAEISRCPYCQAMLTQEPDVVRVEPALDPQAQSLTRLFGFFAALLGISVVAGVMQHVAAVSMPHRLPKQGELLALVVILEALDTVLILAAWAWVGMKYREPARSVSFRAAAWVLALPLLGLALLLNVGYHHVLQQELGVAPDPIKFTQGNLLTAWVLAICLQPAVMEELFFRYLMFGALRPVMGGNMVVWITAVMFAAAHVGVPLSMPVLFVLGVLLGYARLASGSIYLPMILHFVHNAVVMALNSGRF
jgi:uncharacterized protein